MKKSLLLCLLCLAALGRTEARAESSAQSPAQSSVEQDLRAFVGQSDSYIGRRFRAQFPRLYGRLVSICCLKDGGKLSEVRWYTRSGAGAQQPCRALFRSRDGRITTVEILGEGCGR